MDVIFFIIAFGILLAIPVMGLLRQEEQVRRKYDAGPARDGIRPENPSTKS
jgi:hypothetical protein